MVPLQLPLGLELSLPVLLLLAGTGLIVAEALAPGAHFIVVGIALLVAGLVGLVVGAGAFGIFLMMLAVLLAGGLSLYGYREFDFYGGKGRQQTSDSAALRGKTGRATERVTTSGGEVKLDGGGFNPFYAARSMEGEIPEGTEVMVIDPGGGNVVVVEPLSAIEDAIDRELAEGRRAERDRDRDGETESA
ncbi:NfeD family protein [Halomarina ordinaria]|uniref:NfeD family protein n=1 Tax=Halomarina ordinaria TaxID=3033939 RepID=A0ABD5UCU0_9EURY|nr:NfeD family protein [Halomarina sp. PSRA2]